MINVPEITYDTLLFIKNDTFKLLSKFFVKEVEKSNFLDFEIWFSTSILVIKIAVNKEVIIPIKRVVANPLIGPVPKINSTNAVTPVVIFASKIDDKALLKPSETACLRPFSRLSSSLTLSKISTLASTDIPIVKTIPAMPGKVSTAPSPERNPKIKTIFKTKATSANKPALP